MHSFTPTETGFLSTTFDLAILTEVRCLLEALAAPRRTANRQKVGFSMLGFVNKNKPMKRHTKDVINILDTYHISDGDDDDE